MTTSVMPSSTSTLPSTPSTSTKPSGLQHLNPASPNTGTLASPQHDFGICWVNSDNFTAKLERHRWLIQQVDTGLFFSAIKDGELQWVKHPLEALQHCQMEIACNNLFKLREYYNVPQAIRLEPVMFYAYPSRPTQWFTDYD